mmetsp:Transcript_28480/g.39222  ORF Transcript_28480/g.39222 Transcript_28480/m.39222 type:complete len:91 (-) Transcript_28480:938-1210(-)
MLFRSTIRSISLRSGILQQPRNFSGVPSQLYQNIWRKSNVFYILYVVAGCVVLEGVYGTVTSSLWESVNYGKLYHQIDWSQFKSEEEEEE